MNDISSRYLNSVIETHFSATALVWFQSSYFMNNVSSRYWNSSQLILCTLGCIQKLAIFEVTNLAHAYFKLFIIVNHLVFFLIFFADVKVTDWLFVWLFVLVFAYVTIPLTLHLTHWEYLWVHGASELATVVNCL